MEKASGEKKHLQRMSKQQVMAALWLILILTSLNWARGDPETVDGLLQDKRNDPPQIEKPQLNMPDIQRFGLEKILQMTEKSKIVKVNGKLLPSKIRDH